MSEEEFTTETGKVEISKEDLNNLMNLSHDKVSINFIPGMSITDCKAAAYDVMINDLILVRSIIGRYI